MYPYLTGSASWLVLNQLTQVFGVRGLQGDLVLSPKLVKEEFDAKGRAQVSCQFAGKSLCVTYVNKRKLDFGAYEIQGVFLNGRAERFEKIPTGVRIKRQSILGSHRPSLEVILG